MYRRVLTDGVVSSNAIACALVKSLREPRKRMEHATAALSFKWGLPI
jgi:hypothetical protein